MQPVSNSGSVHGFVLHTYCTIAMLIGGCAIIVVAVRCVPTTIICVLIEGLLENLLSVYEYSTMSRMS